jgi:hypothetical protein
VKAIDFDDLESAIAAEYDLTKKLIAVAMRDACIRLRNYLVKRCRELGITDLGGYERGFRVVGTSVINDAPHAGIVELGAPPHPVSEDGVRAIAAWVRRKLRHSSQPRTKTGKFKTNVFSRDEADEIAEKIAWKIRHYGQEPRYVVRDALEDAAPGIIADALERQIRKVIA